MIDLFDLGDKVIQVRAEERRVVVVEDVEVDAMATAGEEGSSIANAARIA